MKNKKLHVLVTGGAGYIGSHTIIELISEGFLPVVIDNLSNSDTGSLEKIEKLTAFKVPFIEGDIRDEVLLEKIFNKFNIDSVMHFAGLKAVGESVEKPLTYYRNNVEGTIELLEKMSAHNVKRMIFSSSCTVYGNAMKLPVDENTPLEKPTSPYGMSKLIIERILDDIYESDPTWSIGKLRYFNPVGAHPSGLIGEKPTGKPNNLMPLLLQAASGRIRKLDVFGDDYNTPDGSCIRDYIHVVDLAKGHIAALKKCKHGVNFAVNLGSGCGYSVLEMISAFESINKVKVPHRITKRRAGDVENIYANIDYAKTMMGWIPEKSLDDICRDSWNWEKNLLNINTIDSNKK